MGRGWRMEGYITRQCKVWNISSLKVITLVVFLSLDFVFGGFC